MRVQVAVLTLVLAVAPGLAEAQWRTSVLPVVGSAPETGGQFGVALFRTRQPEDSLGTRPSSMIGNAVLTMQGQQRAFIEYDRWTAGNERRLQVLAIASKFPLPFHGFGDDTPDSSVNYEPSTFELSVTRSRKSGASSWRYLNARMVDTRAAFLSSPVGVPCDTVGCPIPTGICDCGPIWDNGGDYRLGLVAAGWIRDSRDNLFAPSRGVLFDVSLAGGFVWRPNAFEGRSPLARLRVDGRAYHSLANGGVIAGQVSFSDATPNFPLDQVMLVGHHTLNRGYTMGRFRERGMFASQVEWRGLTRFWNDRIGFAAFSGVAFLDGPESRGRALPSGGAGLRYRLDPRTRSTIRVDYAIGASGQSGLYVAFNEAF